MKGQVAQARSLTEQYTDFAELQQPGRAIGEVLVAHVAIAQGDFDTAVALLQRAAEVLEPTGYSWGSLALILRPTRWASGVRPPAPPRRSATPKRGTG